MPILQVTEKENRVIVHSMREELCRIQKSGGNQYGPLNLEQMKSLIGRLEGKGGERC